MMKSHSITPLSRVLVGICISFTTVAQEPKSFDLESIEKFLHISDEKVSRNSRLMAWRVEPAEGDGYMMLLNNDGADTVRLERCVQLHFNYLSDYALGIVSPPHEEVRLAKMAKKPKEKWPKNILIRVSADFQIDTVGEVEKLYFPEKSTEIAYFTAPSRPNPIGKDSANADTAAPKPSKNTIPKEKPLYHLNIKTGDTAFIANASDVAVSADGMWLLYTSKNQETSSEKKILKLFKSSDATQQVLDTLSFDFKKLLLSDYGTYLSWLSVADSASDPPVWKWTVAQNTGGKRIKIQFSDTLVLNRYLNADGDWIFSESESRLYLTLLPERPLKQKPDSTKLEEERPEFDLYTHADYHLMTWQLANLGSLRSKGLKAVYHTKKKKPVLLTTDVEEYVYIDSKKDNPLLLVQVDVGLQEGRNWEFPNEFSYTLVNVDNGRKIPVISKVRSRAVLSPGGNFVIWFDPAGQVWKCFRVKNQMVVTLGTDVATQWHKVTHDLPSPAPPYGMAGFTADDRQVWLYDRHHIYACDPNGKAKSQLISTFSDDAHEVRWKAVYQKEDFIGQVNGKALLVKKNLHSLEETLILFNLATGKIQNQRVLDKSLFRIRGGEFGPWFLLREESYLKYPEIQTADSELERFRRWSDLGLQYDGYRRGQVFKYPYKVRLSNDSLVALEGLVYMDTAAAERQPGIVYFYERNAENMHRHYSPRFSRSIINPLVYVSHGYAVVVPDIVYTPGNPGQDALRCVSAAVDSALRLFDRIDGSRLGLNGQSWGGYQVAYIITQTDRYKAAFAGAPVANMTSAYGGIRWGTGYSRISQYEQGQSRIGAPLWDNPQAYIQNSPLFHLPRVETPLLIMHNDRDGAVPYYQGIELFMGLNRLKKPVWMLVYNKEDHNLTQLKNMRDLTGKVLDFYNHFLKGEPMPEWMKGIPATRKGLDF